MGEHPWWSAFGQDAESADELASVPAREFVSAIAGGTLPTVSVTALRNCKETGRTAVRLEVEVERPQDLAYPLRATEPIAVVFAPQGGAPCVLALRNDFPDTPHQNWTPQGAPCSLCIDDRPWPEARLTYRPIDFVRRIQLWLAKAARGELHDTAQPPDPLFFNTQLAIVVPRSALMPNTAELVGFLREDNRSLIITRRVGEVEPRLRGLASFLVMEFRAAPRSMTRLRHAPTTLAALNAELGPAGLNLEETIRARVMECAGVGPDDVRRQSSRLAIVVAFPIVLPDGGTTNDLRAFISLDTVGQMGVAWGLLLSAKDAGVASAGDAYIRAVGKGAPVAPDIRIEPAQVHFAFDRELAAGAAGHPAPDRRRAVLVGAGALGSQVAIDLAREGAFTWTVVDNDNLLPHNLARHALLSDEVGSPKASALARQMGWLLDESFAAIVGDIALPDAELGQKLAEADLIIDASASVSVSRYLGDYADSNARRVCLFFNPAGTAVVLLIEDLARSVTLRDLEAQYHRLVQTDPALEDHLRAGLGLRYSGSCRALTNRIPATSAALLSALGARGLMDSLQADGAAVKIWRLNTGGRIDVVERAGAPTHRIALGEWTIAYDDDLLSELAHLRNSRLPRETGGVLLGIADMSRKSVHVSHALPEPEDSRGSLQGFERGVVGLNAAVSSAAEASLHQLGYVGEWHSHPPRSSPLPSATDLGQIVWLSDELENEGLPGVMAIAAEGGAFTFVLIDRTSRGP